MKQPHDPKVRERCVELLKQGMSYRQARQTLVDEFDAAPHLQTIQRWWTFAREHGEGEGLNKLRHQTDVAIERHSRDLVRGEIEKYLRDNGAALRNKIEDAVGDEIAPLTKRLELLIHQTIDEVERVLEMGPGPYEPRAAWLSAVTKAFSQAVEKYQLVMGDATQRHEISGDIHHDVETREMRVMTIVERYGDVFARILERNRELPEPNEDGSSDGEDGTYLGESLDTPSTNGKAS